VSTSDHVKAEFVLHECTGPRQPPGRDRTATREKEKVARSVEEGLPMNAEELEA
jgi:hypothetical protein